MRQAPLFEPLTLPGGTRLANRIAKAAMSDALGDGRGNPTAAQIALYRRWAEGGAGLILVGEVQSDPRFAEKPGNLVLRADADLDAFRALAMAGAEGGAQLWLQLGHAGAMAHPPIGTPKGPSALDLPGLRCAALTTAEIAALPAQFATTARLAKELGFGGVQIHAAHGFLLSQFLSPLFNRRTDRYGGDPAGRMRLLREVVAAVRAAVGPGFGVGLKLNATDGLSGGLDSAAALGVLAALEGAGLDLVEISGGTYFPGAPAVSEGRGTGPYFLDFARRARAVTRTPLMLTGGIRTLAQATAVLEEGAADVIGLARAMVLDPALPQAWAHGGPDPAFPRFADPPANGVTAWYTQCLAAHAGAATAPPPDANAALAACNARDAARVPLWNARFGG